MNKKVLIGLGVLAVAGIGLYVWNKRKGESSDEKSDFLGFGKKKKKKVKENKGKNFGWGKGLGNKHKDDIATIQATQSQLTNVMSGQGQMVKGWEKHNALPLPTLPNQATQSQPQSSMPINNNNNYFNQPRMFRGFKRF